MAIDTLNSNSITISRESTVFKVYYLKEEQHFFGYCINESGIIPLKSSNNKEIVEFIFENLEKERGDLQIHIRYSIKLPKKQQKQIQAVCGDNNKFSYYNISKLIRLIK
jgi:hypothetical protein